jgi:hypothetical protein
MPPKIISKNPQYILSYVDYCFKSNTEYNIEDIEWIIYRFCSLYSVFNKEPEILYKMLALVNINSFCGYFSLSYNNNLLKAVKERDGKEFKTLLINPTYDEIYKNKLLNASEMEDLSSIFDMEALIHNLTLKRISVLESDVNFEELYKDSYNEMYNKIFSLKISQNRSDFQGFIFLTEYNPTSRNSHVYTYKLIDILTQCITSSFTYEISQNNKDLIRERFSTEMKLVEYFLRN